MSGEANLNLATIWPEVRRLAARSLGSVIGSVNEDGSPHLTPIGTLYLRNDCTGYYLERFPVCLPGNLERDPHLCVYLARDGLFYWMRSMMRGRFQSLPAIRLSGRAGQRRPATDEERARFLRKVRIFRWTRGYDLLWGDLAYARELVFDGYQPVRAGTMTAA